MEITALQIKPEKNPLIYLEFENQKLRAVIDQSNKCWFVINDVCGIVGFANPDYLMDRTWLKPFLSFAKMDAPEVNISLCLINLKGIEALLSKIRNDNKDFIEWIKFQIIPNINDFSKNKLPVIDLHDLEN